MYILSLVSVYIYLCIICNVYMVFAICDNGTGSGQKKLKILEAVTECELKLLLQVE